MEKQSETLSSKKNLPLPQAPHPKLGEESLSVSSSVSSSRSFRFLIEKGFHLIQGLYQDQAHLVRNLYHWPILFNC